MALDSPTQEFRRDLLSGRHIEQQLSGEEPACFLVCLDASVGRQNPGATLIKSQCYLLRSFSS